MHPRKSSLEIQFQSPKRRRYRFFSIDGDDEMKNGKLMKMINGIAQ